MNRLRPFPASRYCFLFTLLSFGLLCGLGTPESLVAQNCVEIVEHSFTCEDVLYAPTPVYRLKISFKNRSNFTINRIHLEVFNAQGKGLGSYMIGAYTQPGEMDETGTYVVGAMPGERITARIMISEDGHVSPTPKMCVGDFAFTLPNCSMAQGYDCLEPFDIGVQCVENSINYLRFTLKVRNHTDLVLRNLDIAAVHPNHVGGGVSYFYLPYLRSGEVWEILATHDLPRSTDSYMILNLKATGDSLRSLDPFEILQRSCATKVWVDVSHCPINGSTSPGNASKGFEIINSVIECDSAWRWCFNVRNLSKQSFRALEFGSYSANYRGDRQFDRLIPPGEVSERICLKLPGGVHGFKAPEGQVALRIRTDSANLNYHDTVTLSLPECAVTGQECCDGFTMNFANVAPVAAPNGLVGLLGLTSAGPTQIGKVSATIVSSTVNNQSASAYFNSGTMLNSLGAGAQTPSPFGEELIWNASSSVSMNTPSLFLNWLRFPPMAPNARHDTIGFCVRWRFTDNNCRTCDTMICYQTVRNQFFFNNTRIEREKSNVVLSENGTIHGELAGETSGTMSIDFPELPADQFGTVTFKGLKIQSGENARIISVTSDDPQISFSTEHGLASAEFTATAGEKLTLSIDYDDLKGKQSLAHFLLVAYESSLQPGVEKHIPLSAILRQEGVSTGGDLVEAVDFELQRNESVQTFALHLGNTNYTAESLAGLRIVAGDGVKILAVGPTSSESEALLRFGSEGEVGRAYVSEASEGTVSLTPGSERNPIYITLAMDQEADPTIGFATLNGLDEVVTQGELNLSNLSSVSHTGVTGTSIELGQSTPNPATGEATIPLRLTSTERVRLVIRDAEGREVLQLLENELLTAGAHLVAVDLSNLSSGTYFYTLETTSGSETRKLVLQK